MVVTLRVQKRKGESQKASSVRKEGRIPAALYGPEVKGILVHADEKEFLKTLREAGESSLVDLDVEGERHPVLIHEIQRHAVTGKVIHADFYQPSLKKQVKIEVPLVFEGEAPAVKDLGGTFIKQIQEVEVSALPQDLPHEIRVDISRLATFEDKILVSDLIQTDKVKILANSNDVVAQVVPAEDVEAELAKPMEEKVEEVKVVEKEKKEEEGEEKEGKEKKEEKKQ
ncbi:MAG: 50S ribosomal protein L25 [Candidatus Wildermuthbacteria bacterium]|nr:50S ribosomal protein L25 [Candidatus Wildermuthbacteria bacterium]